MAGPGAGGPGLRDRDGGEVISDFRAIGDQGEPFGLLGVQPGRRLDSVLQGMV
jgi:hypothetical protein